MNEHAPQDRKVSPGLSFQPIWDITDAKGMVIGTILDSHADLILRVNTIDAVTGERDERRTVMADVVRALSHGCAGLSHGELAPAVKRIVEQRDALREQLIGLVNMHENQVFICGKDDEQMVEESIQLARAAIAFCEKGQL